MTVLSGSSKQYIGLVDMLCEGPIYGLVEGKNSVYLDDVPFENSKSIGSFTSSSSSTARPVITSFSDSTTANVQNLTLSSAAVGKYALIQVEKVNAGDLTILSTSSDMGITTILMERSSGTFGDKWNSHANNNYLVSLKNGAGQTIYLGGIVQAAVNGVVNRIALVGYGSTFWNFHNKSRVWNLQLEQSAKIVSVSGTSQFTTETAIDNYASLTNVPFVIQDTVTVNPTNYDPTASVSKVEGSTLQFRRGLQTQPPIQQVHGVSGGVTKVGNSAVVEIRQINNTSTITGYTSGTHISPNTSGYPETQSLSKDGDATPKIFAASAFGVSGGQISQVDEINLRMSYNALITQNNENGDKEYAHAIYVFEIRTKYGSLGGTGDDGTGTGGWTSWRRLFSQHGGFVIHKGRVTSAVAFDHTIGLQRFAPFDNFEIRVTRLTRHAGLPVWSDGRTGPNGKNRTDKDKWSLQATASTGGANLSATLKDKFSYPNTAIAAVSFSSKTYSNLPKRSYHLRGLHVKIPDSYLPREYSDDGVAKYDDLWTGNFRDDLYYTDNPAWVFYDIVTNNRYGAGRWLEELNINKFALYRIAKYCDELVDNGNGGTEPRFRANVYLAKATDVYKVLKDMATIFTGMLYWLDGQLTAVQDVPSDPVYTFTKGNVIDGKFNYESSGRKTRSNQVVVTWNDPKLNYEPAALIVEDREDIVRTRKIISQKSVAMGATSEGQALRYGRWKLWTAQNQKEVVSFETGLQGAFIRPGDVINVQDRDRYGVDYSGLIKSVDSANNYIVLDRLISTVSNANSWKLHTLVTSYAAFYTGLDPIKLNSDGDIVDANTAGTVYQRGDILNAQQVYVATGSGTYTRQSILNEEDASNAFYKSGSDYIPLQTDWKPHSYVVTKDVNTVRTNNDLTEIVVDSAWGTEVPAAGTIWALSAEDADNVGILGSKKEYRVLGIAHNDNKQTYTISAVEHYNIKFDAVDKDYDLGIVPNQAYAELEDPDAEVPPPGNVYVVLETDKTKDGEELRLEWTKPQQEVTVVNTANQAVTDLKDYEFLNGFEVYHNIPYMDSPIFTQGTSYKFDGLVNSNYVFRVRTVSRKGNYSDYVTTAISTDDPFSSNVPRVVGGLPKGIVANSSAFINHNGDLTDEEDQYTVAWPAGTAVAKSIANEFAPSTGDSSSSASSTTSVSPIKLFGLSQSGTVAYTADSSDVTVDKLDAVGGDTNWHYLLYDGNAYLADWNSVTLDNLPFMNKLFDTTGFAWRGNPQTWRTYNRSSVGTSTFGTVAAGTNVLKRSGGNSFLDHLSLRDIIHFDGERLDSGTNNATASFRMWKIKNLAEVGSENVVSIQARADGATTTTPADITGEFSDGDIITIEGVSGATDSNGASVVNNQFYYVKRISGVNDRVQLYKNAEYNAATVSWTFTNPLRASGSSPDISNAYTEFTGFFRKAKVKAAKIVAIVDADTAFLDRTFEDTISSVKLYFYRYTPNYSFDAVFGRVKWDNYNTSTTKHTFSLEKFIFVDKGLEISSRRVEVVPEIPVLQFTPEGATQITQPGVITVDVTGVGFDSPEFRLLSLDGAGSLDFNTPATSYDSPDTTGGFTKTYNITTESQGNNFPWDNGDPVIIRAEVRESNATGINATGAGQITKITSGSDGIAGKTVHLVSEDYSIIYDEAGRNPTFNGSDTNLTFTATANNFTNPEFKFTFDGSSLQSTTNFTQTGFGSFAAGTNNAATATVAIPSTWSGNWNSGNNQRTFNIKVEVREAATSETAAGNVEALDEIGIIGVHANKDGYWAIVSNPGHTVVTDVEGVPVGTPDSNGFVTATNSGTTIEVGRGRTVLTPYTGSTAWNSLAAQDQESKYNVTFTKSPTNTAFNVGAQTVSGNILTLADHEFSNTNWTIDTASLGFAIELEDTGETINLSQSFSKSKQGFGGISVINSNVFESLPVDPVSKRPFDYAATATTLNVFMSGINLPYYRSGASIPATVNAYWQFSTIASATGITAGTVNSTVLQSLANGSTGALSIPKASSMTADTATITWQLAVNIRGADGAFNTEYVTTTQSLKKNPTNANISGFLNINHYVFDGDTTTSSPSTSSYTLSAISKYLGSGDDPINPYITYQEDGGTETAFTSNTENSDSTKTTSTKSFTRPAYSTSGTLNYPITYTVRLYDWDGTTGTLAGDGVLLDEDTVSLSASRTPADNVVMELTNENETVASTNPDANITGSPLATTTANIYIGGVLSNSGWTFTKSSLSGVTASFDSTNTNQLKITQVNSGFTSGQITITATHSSYSTHQAVFTLSRTNDGVAYRIVPDQSAVLYNPNTSSYTPSNATVNFAFKKIKGGASTAFTGGAYKIDNGSAVTGSSSASHTFSATTPSSVNVKLYSNTGATQLVDEETVPLIIGGEDGDSITGPDGDSIDVIFIRSATAPSTPSPSSGTPSGWSTNVAGTSGTDILWAAVGTKAGTATNYTWQTPYQVEGTAVAEVAAYRLNSSSGASGGSFNFTNATLTPPSNWSISPPSLANNGDAVYVIVGTASGGPKETSASITWSSAAVYAKRTDGQSVTGPDGDSVDVIFKRSATAPSTPAASSGTPSGWSSTAAGAAGTALLWASIGTKAGTATNYTWGAPYQVEGTAVAEVAAYRKDSTAGASGGSFNFTNATLTPPSNWSIHPPSLTANGEVIYVIVGTASGGPKETAASITWGSPATFAQRTDGQPGTGTAGADAPKIATGYVYSTQNTVGPGAGVTASYSFSGTPGFTTINSNWSENPPTFNSTNNTIYYSKYTAVEEVNASDVPQGYSTEGSGLSFGTVQTGTSFTGLVTFHSGGGAGDGAFSTDGGSNFTTIDGGNISSNSIATSSLVVGNPTGTSYMKLFDSKIEIYNNGNLRVKLGQL